jgi:hypothetical protein
MSAKRPLQTSETRKDKVRILVQKRKMFRLSYIVAVALVAAPASATEITSGKFKCTYNGDWYCGSPNGICIDSVRRGVRASLDLDVDKGHIRLDGLDGVLKPKDPASFDINWQLAAFGTQTIEFSDNGDDGLIVQLINDDRTRISEFSCKQIR